MGNCGRRQNDGPNTRIGNSGDDLHLSSDSPCIDAGNNDADTDTGTDGVQELPDTDLDGSPRFVDDPDTHDTGNGTPPVVDMGAYENQG